MRFPHATLDIGRSLLIIPALSAAGSALAKEDLNGASGKILFTRQQSRQDDLYLLHLSELRIGRPTDHQAKNSHGAVPPDGERVVSATSQAGNGDIIRMEADGSGPVSLTRSSARDKFPAWSPDGNGIALSSDRGGEWDIYLVDVDGSGRSRSRDIAMGPDGFRSRTMTHIDVCS